MIWKFIPSILLAIVAVALAIASMPTPGGTDANVVLLFPALALALLAIVAALIAWLI
jgi:hypothetical protein